MWVNVYRDVISQLSGLLSKLLFIGLLTASGALWADGKTIGTPVEDDGVVKLIATLQNSPAFTGVVWKLYRTDLPEKLVMTIRRHSAIVNLRPGRYRAVARLKSTARSRLFKLESKGEKEIILSMDK